LCEKEGPDDVTGNRKENQGGKRVLQGETKPVGKKRGTKKKLDKCPRFVKEPQRRFGKGTGGGAA